MRKLAIAIPCFNRSDVLKTNLDEFETYLSQYDACVCIYDDSTNNDVKEMIENSNYTFELCYLKNEKNLGHDLNCINVLSNTKAEFIWYIGDSYMIEHELFKKVYDRIKNDPDGVIVCTNGLDFGQKEEYNNLNEFYRDLGWYICLSGCTIYSRKNLELIMESNVYEKYINSNFIQTGIFIESIMKDNIDIKCIYYTPNKNISFDRESYWRKEAFKVFGYDWYNFNMSLPNNLKYKEQVIKKHSRYTSIFGIRGLVSLKSKYKNITFSEYKKYKKEMNVAIDNKFIFFTILFTPRFICKFIINVSENTK